MKARKLLFGGAATAVLAGAMVTTAFAASVISNGSFETGVNPGVFVNLSAGNSTSIPGWTVASGDVDYKGSYWVASDGSRSLDLNGNHPGAISQTFPTVAGHTYKVMFDMAGNPAAAGASVMKTMDVDAGGAPTSYSFNVAGHSTSSMGWTAKAYHFKATGSNTTLTFKSTTNSPSSQLYGPALDNVVVTDVLKDKDQCKNDGWKAYTDPSFKNQGACVSYAQHHEHDGDHDD